MKEGIKGDYIIKVGSPLFEVLKITKLKLRFKCFKKYELKEKIIFYLVFIEKKTQKIIIKLLKYVI